jgi:ankyrin repeat protein
MSDEDVSKELYNLCLNIRRDGPNRFEKVQKWLDNSKDNDNLLIRATNYKDEKYNFTPLHYLVMNKPPSDLVKRLLQLAPDTIKVQNIGGRLPLHIALIFKVSSAVIYMLFNAHPKAVEVQDNGGYLPLHFALRYNASSNVIKMLVDAFPGSTTIKNNDGEVPLDLYDGPKEKIGLLLTPSEQEKKKPVSEASYELLDLCIDAFERKKHEACDNIQKWITKHEKNHNFLQEAANYKSNDNRTPLHYIAGAKPRCALVKRLKKLAPESLKVQDDAERLPLHWACHFSASPDVISILVKAYPNATKVQDEEGRLPLHYASKNGAASEVINLLIDEFHESRDTKDNNGKYPLDYASANKQLHDLLRGAHFSKPYENNPKDPKTINILNKTGRRLKVVYREALPKKFFQGGGIHFFKFGGHADIAQFNDPNLGRSGVYVVEPDENQAIRVKDCEGLYFDFWCYSNELYGWAENHRVKKGYTQEIRGQPYKLKES